MGTKTSVDELNKLLRGELSAVETYQMAIDKLEATSMARPELESCMGSHQQRAMMLRDQILTLGGQPVGSSGPWGAFAKAVEGTAKIFGEKAAIYALEEGEDHGLKDYKKELDDKDLDATSRSIVIGQLLPAQQQTHARLSALKKQLKA
jgi:bacterioferritin (cytochrome b1)